LSFWDQLKKEIGKPVVNAVVLEGLRFFRITPNDGRSSERQPRPEKRSDHSNYCSAKYHTHLPCYTQLSIILSQSSEGRMIIVVCHAGHGTLVNNYLWFSRGNYLDASKSPAGMAE
jgi:hypothetical protein